MIDLTNSDLLATAALLLVATLLNIRKNRDTAKTMLVAAIRTLIQLSLIGVVLKEVFATAGAVSTIAICTVMLFIAGFEVQKRQAHRFGGRVGVAIGMVSISAGSILILIFAMQVAVQPTPWYSPRYVIPILGMLLGNTMNGLSITLDRLHGSIIDGRKKIEARLILGDSPMEAIEDHLRTSIRAGLIPITNAMAAAGVVSLPGMMTGQILGGANPAVAVRYQIFIMFLIAAATWISIYAGTYLSVKNVFDSRERLCWRRLKNTRR